MQKFYFFFFTFVDAWIRYLSYHLFLQTYLSNASNRDGDTMSSVDFVTLHIQSQSVQWDSERKWYIQKNEYNWNSLESQKALLYLSQQLKE